MTTSIATLFLLIASLAVGASIYTLPSECSCCCQPQQIESTYEQCCNAHRSELPVSSAHSFVIQNDNLPHGVYRAAFQFSVTHSLLSSTELHMSVLPMWRKVLPSIKLQC